MNGGLHSSTNVSKVGFAGCGIDLLSHPELKSSLSYSLWYPGLPSGIITVNLRPCCVYWVFLIILSKCITVFLSLSSVIFHQVVNLPRFIQGFHRPLQILFHWTILLRKLLLFHLLFFSKLSFVAAFFAYICSRINCPILGFQDFHFLYCVCAYVCVLTSTYQGVNHTVPHCQCRTLNVGGLFIQNLWENHLSLKSPIISVTKLFPYWELVRYFFFWFSHFPTPLKGIYFYDATLHNVFHLKHILTRFQMQISRSCRLFIGEIHK